MTPAAKILEMIEKVAEIKAEAEAEGEPRILSEFLDEIDEAVAKYEAPNDWMFWPSMPQYTRSRDALKAIRPEGWLKNSFQYVLGGFVSVLYNPDDTEAETRQRRLPTEELAELHAIIQATEHMRGEG